MAYIPMSRMSDGQVRALMFTWVMYLPSGIGLAATAPGGVAVFGVVLAAVGIWFMWQWWVPVTKCTGKSRRLLLIGSVLAVLSAALLALTIWLFFNPDKSGAPLSAYTWVIVTGAAGIACLMARIVVGMRRLRLPPERHFTRT